MKLKFSLVLVFLLIGSFPIINYPVSGQNSTNVPAPIFTGVDDTGTPTGSFIYPNNTVIEISYEADRFDVDGLMLLGSGSNLTEDYNSQLARNFTKHDSFQSKSFYRISLNISSYTYFYAYAWSGTFDNGTMEELDIFADQPGHQLWIEEGKLFPRLDADRMSAEQIGEAFYSPVGKNITVVYLVRNNIDNASEVLTLSYSANKTGLYDPDESTRTDMNRTSYIQINDFFFSVFRANITMSGPRIYFTAFNDVGWERDLSNNPQMHTITNGFGMEEIYSQDVSTYTIFDTIEYNISTYNETSNMEIGFRYRTYENDSKLGDVDWNTFNGLTNVTSEFQNNTFNGIEHVNSTLVKNYTISLNQTFNAGYLVQIQSFARFGSSLQYNISLDITEITIVDPTPTLDITSSNMTITNEVNATIFFSFSSPLVSPSASLNHTLPDNNTRETNLDITSLSNYTVDFTYTPETNTTVIEGTHVISINVTNSYNLSVVKKVIFYLDSTPPTIDSFNITNLSSEEVSTDGLVSVSFEYSDNGPFDKGISRAILKWGNNVTIDVTNKTRATFDYSRNGEYTINITVFDKAGNVISEILTVTVEIPGNNRSVIQDSPITITPVLITISLMAFIIQFKRKKPKPIIS